MTFTLRTILAGLTLAAVLLTAGLVHTTWLNTARGGVDRAIAATSARSLLVSKKRSTVYSPTHEERFEPFTPFCSNA